MTTSLRPQLIIAVLFVGVFGTAIYFVFSSTLEWSATQENIAIYLLGILSAALLEIIHFFYSSSAGSKAKTDAMVNKPLINP